MNQHRASFRVVCTILSSAALTWTIGTRAAWAAIKVACIGEHTTHSHAFPANNREAQPVGMQEYPAQLQTLLGAAYEVRNFGDCCATVLQGYTVAETHPYVNGSNAGDGVGYKESVAYLPDIVVIGSWGRHDWGLSKAPGQMFTLQGFQDGYDDLIKRYQALSSHPKIFISYPIPILNGLGDVPDQGVTTSSVKPVIDAIAKKYNLTIIDLYTPFLNHKDLFKQPPDAEGEGEHVTNAGLTIIANTVYAVMKQQATVDDGGVASDASAGVGDASVGAGGSPGGSDAAIGSGGSGGSGGAGTAGQGSSGDQAGAPVTSGAGGSSNAAGSAAASAASDSSGCSCTLANGPGPWDRAATLLVGGVALLVRRRRRA
jgi:MYXO-CTERM domain-containing protein